MVQWKLVMKNLGGGEGEGEGEGEGGGRGAMNETSELSNQ